VGHSGLSAPLVFDWFARGLACARAGSLRWRAGGR